MIRSSSKYNYLWVLNMYQLENDINFIVCPQLERNIGFKQDPRKKIPGTLPLLCFLKFTTKPKERYICNIIMIFVLQRRVYLN